MTSADGPALLVRGVSKHFAIPHERRHTLKERALHPFERPKVDRLEALSDISFVVDRGEFFGIVGRNGSGKSTLLKCLAGIYRLDEGEIYIDGRVSTFIELGVGFNPDLAARDNVVMNGIMLGLPPAEARERFERIIEFAELEEFVDLKLKNYSSGMHVRLAFSVMIQVDADVLLIDEILAVGDAAFQQKCFDEFFRLRDEGKTIIFVTHDMSAVERFCHRGLLLERGRMVDLGAPSDIADRYLQLNLGSGQAASHELGERAGDGMARVEEVWMEDEHETSQTAFAQGHPCRLVARARFHKRLEDPVFTATFVNADSQNVFIASSDSAGDSSGVFEPGDAMTFQVDFENSLAPGRYWASTVITRPGTGDWLIDRWEKMLSFVVTGSRAGGGLVDLPHGFSMKRESAGSATTPAG